MAEVIFNDQNFETEVLGADVPVLVDFYAEWCGPCKIMGPIIDELVQEYEGRAVKIGKLNVDESPETASKYNVMSIPTLVFFNNGEVRETLSGMQAKESLKEKINSWLKN